MIYSFDIDGTLVSEFATLNTFKVNKNVLQKLSYLILDGHTILLNTSSVSKLKPNLIISNILKYVFLNNEDDVFTDEQQQRIVQNINKNFYSAICVGTHLMKASTVDFEKLKTFKKQDFFDENTISNKDVYIKSIPKSEIIKLRDLLETDPFFGKNLNTKNWGYIDSNVTDSFQARKVLVPYGKKLPETPRMFFARVNNEFYGTTVKQHDFKKEYEYLKKIIDENQIFVEPTRVSINYLQFGAKNYSKATPIEFLQTSLSVPCSECCHFGNQVADIMPKNIASTFLIEGKTLKKCDIPEETPVFPDVCLAIDNTKQNCNTKTQNA